MKFQQLALLSGTTLNLGKPIINGNLYVQIYKRGGVAQW